MVWLLSAIIIGLLIYLYRQQRLIRLVTQQIAQKRQTGSKARVTLPTNQKVYATLVAEIEQLFNLVQQVEYSAIQEKKTLDRAISNIAHDIRTPLTIASGYTQQLLKKEPAHPDLLQKIRDYLDIVSLRLEELLEYRRLLEGAVVPTYQEIDLSQLVTKEVLRYYDMFQKKAIQLELDIQAGVRTQTDAMLYQRIVQNTVSNVLKHGQDTARISLQQQDNYLVLTVQNQVQQPIQQLDKLTTRFYSENMSQTEQSSGLGLYITQQLTELLGGELTLTYLAPQFQVQVRLPIN